MRVTSRSVNPPLSSFGLWPFGPSFPCFIAMCPYYSPLVSSFSRPLCFPSSPRTMNPGHIRLFIDQPMGTLLSSYGSAFPFHALTADTRVPVRSSEVRNLLNELIKVFVFGATRNYPGENSFPACLPGTNTHESMMITPVIAPCLQPPVVSTPRSCLPLR